MSGARRSCVAMLAAVLALLVLAAPASAHPLGNFSINHLTVVSVSGDRVHLRYVLDQAEIPTFQERGTEPATVLARKRAEVLRALVLTLDGRRVQLRREPGEAISFPRGQGGLSTTRIVLPLSAQVRLPARIEIHDGTFPDRVGWKAIVARPGEGTALRSDAPSGDPTHELRSYPLDLLSSPIDDRTATLSARRGTGTLVAPRAPGGEATTTNRAGDGLAGAFERAAAGEGVLIVLLLVAFAWGAVHALSPGHGKAMVAAYLVGTRGTPRHAVALGAIVTITHTAGVFALGLVTLLLSRYVLPEQLYPWLNLASGLLVVAIGASVLRSRIRWGRELRAAHGHDPVHEHGDVLVHAHGGEDHVHANGHVHAHAHVHGAGVGEVAHAHAQGAGVGQLHTHAHVNGADGGEVHDHAGGHGHAHTNANVNGAGEGEVHDHAHGHHHHSHVHSHGGRAHSHALPSQITPRGLIAAGAAAGLIPCPSALVVLLAAVSQHQVALGLLLIVAFSLGLAGTLTLLGLAVVSERRFAGRVDAFGPVLAVLPAASAIVICGVGCLLCLRALQQLA